MYDVVEIRSTSSSGYTRGVALSADDHVVGVDFTELGPGASSAAFLAFHGATTHFAVDAPLDGPRSINAAGIIVGVQFDPTADPETNSRAFVLSGVNANPTLLQPLLPAATLESDALDINDGDEVIGFYLAPPTPSANSWNHAFVYNASTAALTLLDSLPHQMESTTAINNQHQIIGVTRSQHGFLYNLQTESFRTLSFNPSALNDNGLVVGNVNDATAMRDDGSNVQALPTFGGDVFLAIGVNNGGVAVGMGAYTSGAHGNDDFFGFASDGSSTVELDGVLTATSAAWHVIAALAINDAGHILALARRPTDNVDRTVLLIPSTALTASSSRLLESFAVLFGGVSRDGGGWSFSAGHFHRIPPWGPPDGLTHAEREVISGLMIGKLASSISDRAARVELERTASQLVSTAGTRLYSSTRAQARQTAESAGRAQEPSSALIAIRRRGPRSRR